MSHYKREIEIVIGIEIKMEIQAKEAKEEVEKLEVRKKKKERRDEMKND